MSSSKGKKITKDKVVKELKESVEEKLVLRREAPLIGLVFFSITLWVSKLITSHSPGTSLIFNLMGVTVHFHHFHYGIIGLAIGVIISFIEGAWPKRIGHLLFGAGLGFIVDEYWMLLTFNDASYNYFSPEAQYVSRMIGIGFTVIYAAIVVISFFFTRREREVWTKLYDAVETGKIQIDL